MPPRYCSRNCYSVRTSDELCGNCVIPLESRLDQVTKQYQHLGKQITAVRDCIATGDRVDDDLFSARCETQVALEALYKVGREWDPDCMYGEWRRRPTEVSAAKATQVFDTPELLDHILSYCTISELFDNALVNRSFAAGTEQQIRGRTAIQQGANKAGHWSTPFAGFRTTRDGFSCTISDARDRESN